MAKGHTIQVSVLADTGPLRKAFSNLGQQLGLGKIGSSLKTLGASVGVAIAGVGAAAGLVLKNGIKAAGDLEQSIGAVDSIFGSSATQMHSWAQAAAQSVGLARNEYNELGTLIGAQLRNGGTAMDELAPKTNQLITLGADLSSMFGGSTKEAVSALSSALKGERDPIERYGVSLKQAQIDAKAAELGFKKVGGSFSTEAQQAATLALIMEQTSAAHGNFAKESDTLAGKQQRLDASMANISARIGTVFLPAATALAEAFAGEVMPRLEEAAAWLETNFGPALAEAGTWINTDLLPAGRALADWATTNLLPVFQQLGTLAATQLWPTLQALGQWLIESQGWLLPLAVGIGAIVLAWTAWNTAIGIWNAITQLATAAQLALNAAMNANPIGIIALALIGLVAAITYLWNTNEGFREAVTQMWNGIKGAVKGVGDWITGTCIPAITGAWNRLASGAQDIGNRISGFFKGLLDGGRQAVDGVVQFFTGLPGNILSALSNVGSQLAAVGRNMITSLANAFSPAAIINKIKEVIGNAIGFAKRLLGIASPSKVFRQIGGWTIEGFAQGIQSQQTAATRAVRRVGDAVVDAAPRQLPTPSLTGTDTAGINLTINLHSLKPSYEVARDIADAVEDVFRRRGRYAY